MMDAACLALLHDVIEDHPYKVNHTRLRVCGVPDYIVTALDHITKRGDESYHYYLRRVMRNELAWTVKLRDVLFNISAPGVGRRRIMKYALALQILAEDAPAEVVV